MLDGGFILFFVCAIIILIHKDTKLIFDRQIRLRAINKLAKSEKEEDILELLCRLDSDEEINNAIIKVIRTFDSNKVISGIRKLLNNKKHFGYQVDGIIAIRALGLKELVPDVTKQLEHELFIIKELAIGVLDKFDAKETAPELVKQINDGAVGHFVRKLLEKWGTGDTTSNSK